MGLELFGAREYRDVGDIAERSTAVNSFAAQEFGSDATDPYHVWAVGSPRSSESTRACAGAWKVRGSIRTRCASTRARVGKLRANCSRSRAARGATRARLTLSRAGDAGRLSDSIRGTASGGVTQALDDGAGDHASFARAMLTAMANGRLAIRI